MRHKVVFDKKKKKKKYSTGTENCKSFIRSCTAKNSFKAKKKRKKKKGILVRDRRANLDLKGHGVIVRKKEG